MARGVSKMYGRTGADGLSRAGNVSHTRNNTVVVPTFSPTIDILNEKCVFVLRCCCLFVLAGRITVSEPVCYGRGKERGHVALAFSRSGGAARARLFLISGPDAPPRRPQARYQSLWQYCLLEVTL